MNIIKIEDLKPGMAFTKDVFIDGDTLFVPAKVPIKEKELERLLKWKVKAVQTDGTIYKEEKKPTVSQENKKKIKTAYDAAVLNLTALFGSIENHKSVEPKKFQDILKSILPLVLENPKAWLNYALENAGEKENYPQNAINCMIFAVNIAVKMEVPADDMRNLSMAALLHDIGMLRIPQEIRKKQGALSAQELEKIKTHTLLTYRYITGVLNMPEEIGKIALLHHERWDGKGYPRQLAEKQIPLLARILSVADSFEAMVRDTPYRDSMIGYNAVRQILNDNSRRFDSEIIKVFIKSMGIYPVGSYVILNDGSIGVVSKIHEEAPLRPQIRLLLNKEGKKVEDESINLLEAEYKDSFIAKPFNPKEIKKQNA